MENKPSPSYYAAVVVINSDGKVLLGKRKEDGIWTTPGGGAEPGEDDPAQTAVRELFEEAGVVSNVAFLQPLSQIETRNKKICHTFLYVCGTSTITSSKLDPDQEVQNWKWFSIDELPNDLKDDPRRFESVRNGFMKFHGIIKSLTDKLEKGGEGSGIKGHMTNHPELHTAKVLNLATKLGEPPNAMAAHLHMLTNGAVLEGVNLRSGKPLFLNHEQAIAHGYTSQEHREAGNIHYDKAKAMSENIQKLKALKKDVPPEMSKIVKFHERQFKNHFNAADRVENTKKQTEEALQAKKQAIAEKERKVAKSFVEKASKRISPEQADLCVRKLVGEGMSLDTAYAKCSGKHRGKKTFGELEKSAINDWAERVSKTMEGYSFGESPRMIPLHGGELQLVEVDTGIYSGVFKPSSGEYGDGTMERLEKMSIPSLVESCMEKGWIVPLEVEPQAAMPSQIDQISVAPPPPIQDPMDRKIRLMELITKLLS